jgi:antirestriction protein
MSETIRESDEAVEQDAKVLIVPRIYVASLSDHRAGRSHGAWIGAAQNVKGLQARIDEMLAGSPTPMASEYAIHGYDDFFGIRLSAHESLETVAGLAMGIVTYGPAFAGWAAAIGVTEATPRNFRGNYLGSWASLNAFGQEFAADLGLTGYVEAVPENLRRYIGVDSDTLVSDMLLDGEIDTFEEGEGVIHIYLAPRSE